MLQRLHDWGLGPADARSIDNKALRSAAKRGHAEVLEILRTDWGLEAMLSSDY